MKELRQKEKLIDLLVLSILHASQGLEQGRAIANTLLSQCYFDRHWARDWEIGQHGVYMADTASVPHHYHVFVWASALCQQAVQGYEFTAATQSLNHAARVRGFIIEACVALKKCLMAEESLPEQTYANAMSLITVNYARLTADKVCGLCLDAKAAERDYWARVNKVCKVQMRVYSDNPKLN